MVKLGFTGTQQGMTPFQKLTILSKLQLYKSTRGEIEFHQGQCIGADYEATLLAMCVGARTVAHPPTNRSKVHALVCDEVWPEKDYLDRNHDIVDVCDILLVAPKTAEEELRSGTWATWRYAKKIVKPIQLILP